MTTKKYLILALICFLYCSVSGYKIRRNIENVSPMLQSAKPEMDELDTDIVKETGCKYLSLAFNESVLFTKTSAVLEHTAMASILADTTLRDQNQTDFEMHFAIRSSSDFSVLLFSRRHYVNKSRSEEDYEIGFGNKNGKAHLSFMSHSDSNYMHMSSYKETNTAGHISADKYEKLYIKLDDRTLKFGEQCDKQVAANAFATRNIGYHQLEIVQFGFLSKSPTGAKVLYDCPPDFAGCDCGWYSYSNDY